MVIWAEDRQRGDGIHLVRKECNAKDFEIDGFIYASPHGSRGGRNQYWVLYDLECHYTGETGVGKEKVMTLDQLSSPRNQPVKRNCANIQKPGRIRVFRLWKEPLLAHWQW